MLSSIVRKAQTCLIPGKSILDSHLFVRYIVEQVGNRSGFWWVLVNSVSVLKSVDFGPIFRGWIIAIYSGICSVVKLNGHPSGSFSIEHSVHRGCLLFSLLYILYSFRSLFF